MRLLKKTNANNLKKRILIITLIGMSFRINAQITDTGANVGIGITNPSNPLHISSNSNHHQLRLQGTNGKHSWIQFYPSGDDIINWQAGVNTNGFSIYDISTSQYRFNITNTGNIGIGTTNASSKLQLMNGNDGISFDSSEDWIGIGFNRSVRNGQIFDTNKSGWQFTARNDRFSLEGYNGAFSNLLNVLKNGNIGIGTVTTGNHKLAVEGSIGAREIKVEANGWSDFVFENNYRLPTLVEVENYIKEKGHLKDIPSAKEVEKNGFFLGEMDAKLLQKIEELTLYVIEQEKRLNNVEFKNEKLEKENESLKALATKFLELQKRIAKLEKE